jgi:hypothetical protein
MRGCPKQTSRDCNYEQPQAQHSMTFKASPASDVSL